MTAYVVGVDPGLTGALALIGQPGLIAVADIPVMAKGAGAGRVKSEVNPAGLAQLLRDWLNGHFDDVMVVIERVSAMPGQGVAGVFSLGDTLGCIRGVACGLRLPIAFVSPQKWKKHYGLPADKELARARAIQLYPEAALSRKKDHGRSEAILLARYGWEVLR